MIGQPARRPDAPEKPHPVAPAREREVLGKRPVEPRQVRIAVRRHLPARDTSEPSRCAGADRHATPEKSAHLGGPPLYVTRTEGATPFRMVTHIGDLGHAVVAGPTGRGKSVGIRACETFDTLREDADLRARQGAPYENKGVWWTK